MAKRGNGEGTIYYSEKLNKWVGQFTAGGKADGKLNRKSVYGNTRNDVDLDNKLIHITKTLTKDKNGKVKLGETTKTYYSVRDIPITSLLETVLKESLVKLYYQ